MSGLSSFSFLRLPDKVYKSEMSHHAGKGFVFVLGACVISQCVGPNCFLCENMGCKSRWLAENLGLAGALRLGLSGWWRWRAVLSPGSHVGARRKGTSSALSPVCCGWKSRGHQTYSSLFFIFVVSVNNIPWVFLCLFFSTAIFFRRLDQWQLLLQAGKHLE